MLLKDYYTITSQSTDSESGATLFRIRLNGGHEIYKGHFPEKAVSPGVCNLQIMKECAERIVGKELTIKTMAQCKMPAMINKELFDYLDGRWSLEEAVERIKGNTRRYARKQLTWYKKDDQIRWFHPDEITTIIDYITSL